MQPLLGDLPQSVLDVLLGFPPVVGEVRQYSVRVTWVEGESAEPEYLIAPRSHCVIDVSSLW